MTSGLARESSRTARTGTMLRGTCPRLGARIWQCAAERRRRGSTESLGRAALDSSAPDAAHFIDAGTLSFSLLPYIEAADAMLVIDAADIDGSAGAIALFEGAAMDAFLRSTRRRTVHEVGLIDLLDMARLRDCLPDAARAAVYSARPHRLEREALDAGCGGDSRGGAPGAGTACSDGRQLEPPRRDPDPHRAAGTTRRSGALRRIGERRRAPPSSRSWRLCSTASPRASTPRRSICAASR